MNKYVVGMAAFCIGILFNTISIFVIFSSKLLKQSSGIFILCLLLNDIVYLITHNTMTQFYTKWIDLDIFMKMGNTVLACQFWNFLEEFAIYFRYLMMVIIVTERYVYVSGKVTMLKLREPRTLGAVVLINAVISAGCAAYWAYQVKNILPDPYEFGTCAIAMPRSPELYTTWFWMELLVHLAYPDVVLYLTCIIMTAMLMIETNRKSGSSIDDDSRCITKGVIGLAWCHILIQLPYLIINCALLYLDARWNLYDFNNSTWNNIIYTGNITIEVKDFIFGVTFFVLVFVRPFRRVLCYG